MKKNLKIKDSVSIINAMKLLSKTIIIFNIFLIITLSTTTNNFVIIFIP